LLESHLQMTGYVTLDGVTGSGKTLVMADLIAEMRRPALILCHTKELAKQLWDNLSRYFPGQPVELMTSPFHMYRPERVKIERGRWQIIPGRSVVNKEAALRRERAMLNLCRKDCPIIVASSTALFPCAHPDLPRDLRECPEVLAKVCEGIDNEVSELKRKGKSSQWALVNKDITMLKTHGWCKNFSDKYVAHLPQEFQCTPVDLFKQRFGKDWLLALDESHATLPRMKNPTNSSTARKHMLVKCGQRLPSAVKSRGKQLNEVLKLPSMVLFVSATPNDKYLEELGIRAPVVKMVQRPTHIMDPEISFRDCSVDDKSAFFRDMFHNLQENNRKGHQALVACKTQWEVEKLANRDLGRVFGLRAAFVHCSQPPEEQREVMQKFREGKLDVLFGVGLFREGLDFPGVSLVYVLDADRGGFFRTHRDLYQFVGRAARNPDGRAVFMYTGGITEEMVKCKEKADANRREQLDYNSAHGYTPQPLHDLTRRREALQSRAKMRNEDIQEILETIAEPSERDVNIEGMKQAALQVIRGLWVKRARRLLRHYSNNLLAICEASRTGELRNVPGFGPRLCKHLKDGISKVKTRFKHVMYDFMLEEITFEKANELIKHRRMEERLEDITSESAGSGRQTEEDSSAADAKHRAGCGCSQCAAVGR